MATKFQDPLLPTGSLILVTGANGYIASHVVDQLLSYGYSVRGTVRSTLRSSWLAPLYESRHTSPSLQLVEIPNITAPGAYDAALKDVTAVIQTASSTNLSDDPSVVQTAIDGNLNILSAVRNANLARKAAGYEPPIERVVLTSSSWAAAFPQPNVPQHCDASSYDTVAEKTLSSPDAAHLPAGYKGVLYYTLSKVRSEQESWSWHASHPDCGFALNTVLPSTVLGPVLDPKAQPYPSTGGFIRKMYENENADVVKMLPPHWFVDARDTAKLHVAAAVLKGVEGERIYSWAQAFTWPQAKTILEKVMGESLAIEIPDKGEELATRDGKRPLELLSRMGQRNWVGLEDTIKDNIRSFYPEA